MSFALVSVLALSALFRVLDAVFLLFVAPRLLWPYLRVSWAGLVRSPFRVGAFAQQHAARTSGQSLSELVYGETPVFSAFSLLRRAGLSSSKMLLDLGAGRGRVLLAARALGAEARGLELLSEHVSAVEPALKQAGATLEVANALNFHPQSATHLFVTWTCMSEASRDQMTRQLRLCAPGTIVISVTHPVADPLFRVREHRRPLFTWGRADAYIQEKIA